MKTFSLYKNTIKGDFDSEEHKYRINGRHVYNITSILELLPHDHLNFWRMSVYKKTLTEEIRSQYGDLEAEATHNFLWAKKKEKLDAAREVLYDLNIQLNGLHFIQCFQRIFSAPTKESQKALDIGHDVHNWCERYGHWKLGEAGKPRRPGAGERRNSIDAFLAWVADYNVEFVDTEFIVYSKLHDYIGTADLLCKIDGDLYIIDYKTSKGIYIPYMAQARGLSFAYEEEFGVSAEPALLRLPKDGQPYEFKKPELPDSLDLNMLLHAHDLYKAYYTTEDLITQRKKEEKEK